MEGTGAGIDDLRRVAFDELDALMVLRADLDIVVVTNEVGSGIVADTAPVRKFSDLHGWINQHVAHHADRVFLMVCGLPVRIKPSVAHD
jgi:adenosylcobinamide kinase/adenosylcobinamide-phosphate guanylyltransferase